MDAASTMGTAIGIDVGSVSTNLALGLGLGRLRERFGSRLRILGVAVTGSDRHLAAPSRVTLMVAASPKAPGYLPARGFGNPPSGKSLHQNRELPDGHLDRDGLSAGILNLGYASERHDRVGLNVRCPG